MRKVLVITDFDSVGSGYKTIAVPLFTELGKLDEYDVRIIGLNYGGEEHYYPFSVIPCASVQEAHGMASNLIQLWNPDVLIVAMDLPHHEQMFRTLEQLKVKYIAITPLENGPLCLDWAVPLYSLNGVFFISELGKQEALKVEVPAEHLQIGCDTVLWHPATSDEKSKFRDGLGIPQDALVILTVADNQERKNLWAGIRAIAQLKKVVAQPSNLIKRPIRYILVTRESNPYGYKLRSLIQSEDVTQEVMIFERGMPQKDLWGLYAASDVYLQPSKAEGLGLPVLDAMCCKLPVVATRTGAMTELLEDGRGYLIDGYMFDDEPFFRDVWGNSNRVMIDIGKLTGVLYWLLKSETDVQEKAYDYVKTRTWDIPALQLHNKITELMDESKTEAPK